MIEEDNIQARASQAGRNLTGIGDQPISASAGDMAKPGNTHEKNLPLITGARWSQATEASQVVDNVGHQHRPYVRASGASGNRRDHDVLRPDLVALLLLQDGVHAEELALAAWCIGKDFVG
jgi:hypothetical protein